MPADPQRIQSIFLAAIEAADPNARAALLARECGDDVYLRQHVEVLLQAHDRSGSLLDRPAVEAMTTDKPAGQWIDRDAPLPLTERPGMRVGHYKLLQKIGEGGMGVVYMAEQQEPVRRMVALKIIKPGMDSDAVVARFEAERQALALMDHQNIARVFDGGTTESGRPFFIMELVKGIPITRFCDENRLTLRERLELFVSVCQAVQHAHQKGVIHRDLKPSNVLVTLYDGKPVPKVIDFGVAKALHQKLTERTMFTAFGTVVGTLEYMSPEQAEMNALDVDTRSDIYSLGVLLYELLTGTTPLERERLVKAAYTEMLRLIREEEPLRPSMRISGSGQALARISAQRKTEPTQLARLVRGELDWIVMKALEKDRARRYETANGFAADVLRYLGGEAVLAHPPSTAYRLRKFVKRYKGQVLAASVIFLALLAGIVGTTLGLLKAQKNLQRANENLAFAMKANYILESVFNGLDPNNSYATPGDLSEALKDNLKRAVQELQGSAIGDPLTVAQMQNTLGVSLLRLGEPSQAIVLFEKARATMAAKLGPDHADTLQSMGNLASGYRAAGKHDRALPLYAEILKLKKAKFGPDHPDTLTSMGSLAAGYWSARQLDDSVPLFEETLKLQEKKLGRQDPQTQMTVANLGVNYRDAGRVQEALPLLEEAFQTAKTTPTFRWIGLDLLDGYGRAGKTAEAAKLVTELLPDVRKQLPKYSPQLAGMLALFGLSLLHANAFTDAEALLRECLAIREKTMPDAWNTFNTMSMIGGALVGQKKYADAEPLLLKGYEGMKQREKAIPKGGETRIPEALDRLIELYSATNKPDETKKWRAERAKYPQAKKPVAPEKK